MLKEIIQASGKMIFLDKFLSKMRAENKKVIIIIIGINLFLISEYVEFNRGIFKNK